MVFFDVYVVTGITEPDINIGINDKLSIPLVYVILLLRFTYHVGTRSAIRWLK